MPAPSQLAVATSSVQRLVKEEASYHKELEKQQARVRSLEASPNADENAEYQLRQEKQAIAETLAVFPPLRQRIADCLQSLEHRLAERLDGDTAGPDEELVRAKEVVAGAKKALAEGSADGS